jgi:hypothetical protein
MMGIQLGRSFVRPAGLVVGALASTTFGLPAAAADAPANFSQIQLEQAENR